MKEKLRSRTFLELFLSFLLIALLAETGMFIYSFQRGLRENKDAAERENAAAIESVRGYLDGVMNDAVLLAGTLKTTPWVAKLGGRTDVFDDEFDYARRNEISRDFLFYVQEHGEISSRFLFFPERDLVVAQRSWNSASYYFGTIGVSREDRESVMKSIASLTGIARVDVSADGESHLGDSVLIAIPLQDVEHPRAYLCALVDTAVMTRKIAEILPKGIVGVHLTDPSGGCDIVSFPDDVEGLQIRLRTVAHIGWTCSFYIDPTVVTMEYSGVWQNMAFYSVALFAAGAALSYALAALTYRSVERLLRKLPGNPRGKNAYKVIGDSIDLMTGQYRESQRAAALHQLLTGYFEPGLSVPEDLAFRDDMLYRVFCLTKHGGGHVERDRVDAAERITKGIRGVVPALLESTTGDLILIVGFESGQDVAPLSARVFDALADASHTAFAGDVSRGLIGISISYQSALEKHTHLSGCTLIGYYFPLDWESQLLAALRYGRAAVADDILHELRLENERRLNRNEQTSADSLGLLSQLAADVLRVVGEMNLDGDAFDALRGLLSLDSSQAIWAEIVRACAEVCREACLRSEQASAADQRIVDYIGKHFRNCSLSIVALEDALGLSANTLNKSIKSATGQTFLPYLTQLRVEEAKLLLVEGKLKIVQIAEQVGYENEYSFRRAFKRHTGVRVQDYKPPTISQEEP